MQSIRKKTHANQFTFWEEIILSHFQMNNFVLLKKETVEESLLRATPMVCTTDFLGFWTV